MTPLIPNLNIKIRDIECQSATFNNAETCIVWERWPDTLEEIMRIAINGQKGW